MLLLFFKEERYICIVYLKQQKYMWATVHIVVLYSVNVRLGVCKKSPKYKMIYLLSPKSSWQVIILFIIYPSMDSSKYMSYRAVEYKPADHHSVIHRIRTMPVWRANFINMPKICRTPFCTKERQTRRYFQLKQPRLSPFWYVNSFYTSTHLIC